MWRSEEKAALCPYLRMLRDAGRRCPECGAALDMRETRNPNAGMWDCPECGWTHIELAPDRAKVAPPRAQVPGVRQVPRRAEARIIGIDDLRARGVRPRFGAPPGVDDTVCRVIAPRFGEQ